MQIVVPGPSQEREWLHHCFALPQHVKDFLWLLCCDRYLIHKRTICENQLRPCCRWKRIQYGNPSKHFQTVCSQLSATYCCYPLLFLRDQLRPCRFPSAACKEPGTIHSGHAKAIAFTIDRTFQTRTEKSLKIDLFLLRSHRCLSGSLVDTIRIGFLSGLSSCSFCVVTLPQHKSCSGLGICEEILIKVQTASPA